MINTNLSIAIALPDRDLLARLPVLASHERTAVADLVAHLAALRLRPSLYASQGYGSLFAYCRQALRLSEDAASNRIHAAKACLRFPVILDLLASGQLSLSAVRMLRPHLTTENHERVLGRAQNARRADVERLVAELAPQPDVASSVRKLPLPALPVAGLSVPRQPVQPDVLAVGIAGSSGLATPTAHGCPAQFAPAAGCPVEGDPARLTAPPVPRPVVQALSPERYRVQFTIGQETRDILQRLQTLLRREIPDGDAGAIFERGLRLLHERVEAAKFGRRPRQRKRPPTVREMVIGPAPTAAYEKRIRPGADTSGASPARGPATATMEPPAVKTASRARSRYIAKAVKRAVWYRDRGRCAFVSESGQRCVEREFLELHHIQPYALNGSATAANIALRCPRHNAYEAEVVFGVRTHASAARARHKPPGEPGQLTPPLRP